MIIKNENLTIRSAEQKDAIILTMWWNDGKVMEHVGFPEGLNQSIEKTIKQIGYNDNNESQLCIIEVDNKRIGETNYKIKAEVAEIGIKICVPTYQNKGYGTKILKILIKFLFDNYNIEKIILDTNLKNKRAQHVYEKVGFIKLRVNKDSWKDQLGIMQSSVDYEMTRDQYETNKVLL